MEELKSGNFGTVYRAKWKIPPDSLGNATLSTRLYDESSDQYNLNELDDGDEEDEKVFDVAIKFARSDRPNWRFPDKVSSYEKIEV